MYSVGKMRKALSLCNRLRGNLSIIEHDWKSISRYASTSSTDITDGSAIHNIDLPNVRSPHENPLASLANEELREDKNWEKRQQLNTGVVYKQIVDENGLAHAIGRRKRSRARVTLGNGSGAILVNGKSWVDYFNRLDHRDKILRPLDILQLVGAVDVKCEVSGGGITGQAEAIRLGISRALQNWNPDNRPALKKDGLLTRDSRVVESKKAGKKKARKSFQWVKR